MITLEGAQCCTVLNHRIIINGRYGHNILIVECQQEFLVLQKYLPFPRFLQKY